MCTSETYYGIIVFDSTTLCSIFKTYENKMYAFYSPLTMNVITSTDKILLRIIKKYSNFPVMRFELMLHV